jgi:hypothetical protein
MYCTAGSEQVSFEQMVINQARRRATRGVDTERALLFTQAMHTYGRIVGISKYVSAWTLELYLVSTVDYGYEYEHFSLSRHFLTILNQVSFPFVQHITFIGGLESMLMTLI